MNELQNWAFCPQCSAKFTIKNSSIFKLGHPITCEDCSTKFNIFGIYEKIYRDIKIGTKIANEARDIIYSDYNITGSFDDVSILNEYMKNHFNKDFLKNIILNSVIYGTHILQHTKIDNELKFQPIHLPHYEIITEVGTKGGHALYNLVKEIKDLKTGQTIPRDNLSILYVDSDISNDEIGFSLYGMWFRIWALLDIGTESISHSNLLGNVATSKNLTEVYEYYENQMQNTVSIIKMTNGKSERDTLSWRIEKEIFPKIIGKSKSKFFETSDNNLPYPSICFAKDS